MFGGTRWDSILIHATPGSVALCVGVACCIHMYTAVYHRDNSTQQIAGLTMNSAVARMSSVTFLPLLALLFAANTAFGFIAPSLRVSTAVPTTCSSFQHSVPVTRCRVAGTYDVGLRGRGVRRGAGLSMEVEPHVLRLQAAELGSRLRVSRTARMFPIQTTAVYLYTNNIVRVNTLVRSTHFVRLV